MARSTYIVVCLGLAGLALTGCADQRAQQPSLSPESVATQLNGADLEQVRTVWYRLGAERPGVHPSAFKAYGRPAEYAKGPFTTRVFRVDLDGSARGISGGSDALVRIGDAAAWDWQFLAFVDSPQGWRFVGNIDLPGNITGAPVPEVRTLGPGQSWIVVKSCRPFGNGFADQEQIWYQVRDGGLVEVLRTPGEGQRTGLVTPFEVSYHAVTMDTYLTPNNCPAVSLNVEAVYTNTRRDALPGVTELFRRAGTVRYLQDPATGRFFLDVASSDWSQEELSALLTDNTDEFVRLNRTQLVRMAGSGDAGKKQWLARLAQDSHTDEIREELSTMAIVDTEPK